MFPHWNLLQFFSSLSLYHGYPPAQLILSKFLAVFGPCCFKNLQFWPLILGSSSSILDLGILMGKLTWFCYLSTICILPKMSSNLDSRPVNNVQLWPLMATSIFVLFIGKENVTLKNVPHFYEYNIIIDF